MLRILTIIVLVLNATASAVLVSRWQGEGNALDSVGPDNGAVVGGIQYTPGVIGQAFRFPDDGYINVPNPIAGGLVSPSGFTVAGWVRFDGADPPPEGGPGAVINYGTNASGFMIAQNGLTGGASPLLFGVHTNTPNNFTSVTSPFPSYWNLGQVYHFAATFDAATHTIALYRDGQLQ